MRAAREAIGTFIMACGLSLLPKGHREYHRACLLLGGNLIKEVAKHQGMGNYVTIRLEWENCNNS